MTFLSAFEYQVLLSQADRYNSTNPCHLLDLLTIGIIDDEFYLRMSTPYFNYTQSFTSVQNPEFHPYLILSQGFNVETLYRWASASSTRLCGVLISFDHNTKAKLIDTIESLGLFIEFQFYNLCFFSSLPTYTLQTNSSGLLGSSSIQSSLHVDRISLEICIREFRVH